MRVQKSTSATMMSTVTPTCSDWQAPADSVERVHLQYIQKWYAAGGPRSGRGTASRSRLDAVSRCDNTGPAHDVAFRAGASASSPSRTSEDYYVQYLPVGMQELQCPPELMLAQMTLAGVDHCILQAGGGYGAMNDYNAFAQRQYPDRFTGLFHVDEATADKAATLAEMDRAIDVLGLRGLYYAQDHSRHGYARNVDHDDFIPFWEKIVAADLPVLIELSSTPGYDRAGYLGNLAAFDRLLARYPAHRFLLVMGPPVATSATPAPGSFPTRSGHLPAREPVDRSDVPISWGGVGIILPQAQELIRGMRDLFGASKLVWGSDMPTSSALPYRQCVDYAGTIARS